MSAVIQALGYAKIDEYGLCTGFIKMYVQQAIIGKKTEFINQYRRVIEYFDELPSTKENVSKIATELKIKFDNLKGISDLVERQSIVNIFSLIDGIVAQQNTQSKKIAELNKEGSEVFEFTETNTLKEHGGIVKIFSEPRIYTDDELNDFMVELHKLVSEINYNESDQLCVTVSSNNHKIALDLYKKEESKPTENISLLVDINDLHDFNNRRQPFVDRFKRHLSTLPISREYTLFIVEIFTTNDFLKKKLDVIEPALEQLRLIHPIDKSQCERVDENKMSLVHLAAQSCSPELMDLLARKGADLNRCGGGAGMTPAHIAAVTGNYHIIPTLKTHGANLLADTNATILGIVHPSPIVLAFNSNHWKTVALLLANIADINELNFFSKNVLQFNYKAEITNAFIDILKEHPNTYRQVALDVVAGKNALGQLLNENLLSANLFSLFSSTERTQSVQIQQIANELNMQSPGITTRNIF
jgi:hypothetical protein